MEDAGGLQGAGSSGVLRLWGKKLSVFRRAVILAVSKGPQSQVRYCSMGYRSSYGTDLDDSDIASPV